MSQDLTIHIDLNSAVTLADARNAARRFLAWWGNELLACLPPAWKGRFRNLFRTPRLVLGTDEWRLTGFSADIETLPIDPGKPSHETRELLTRLTGSGLVNGVEAQLPQSAVLLRRINLPEAAARHLRSVVRLQLDRLSPYRGDDVSFDCRIVDTNGDDGVGIEVAMISKTVLRNYEQKMREFGLVPRSFTIDGSPLKIAPIGFPWSRQKQLQALLALGGLLLWAAVFWLAPMARDGEIVTLEAKIASLRPAVRAAEAEQQALLRYQLPPAAISPDRQRALNVLALLTKILPSSVHLTEFTLDGNTVRLQGTAPASLHIATLLNKSRLFARIDHPKTPQQQGPGYFELQATLRSTHTSVAVPQ